MEHCGCHSEQSNSLITPDMIDMALALSRQLARRYGQARYGSDLADEMSGVALYCLVRAARSYRPDDESGSTFRTYAWRAIANGVKGEMGIGTGQWAKYGHLRRWHGRHVRLGDSAYSAGGPPPWLAVDVADMAAAIARLSDRLAGNYRLAWRLRHLVGLSNLQIAAWLGLSPTRVGQLLAVAERSVRRWAAEAWGGVR